MKRKAFERLKNKGTTTELSLSLVIADGYTPDNALVMCPYTEYIPLSYLLSSNNFETPSGGYLREKHGDKLNHKFICSPMGGFLERAFRDEYRIRGKETLDIETVKYMMTFVNQYLFFDEPISPTNQRNIQSWRKPTRSEVVEGFNWKMSIFRQRSYGGYVSPYSLYRFESDNYNCSRYYDLPANGMFIPHVLAVIRPEHYLQAKLKFLLTGKIDMDKVVILIDNQLDGTEFPVAGFKSLYKAVKSQILETNAQIYRVPLEFIQKNCFIPKFELKEKNVLKRKQEIERLVEEFYKYQKRNVEIRQVEEEGPYIASSNAAAEFYDTFSFTTSGTHQYTIQTSAEGAESLNTAFTEAGISESRVEAIAEERLDF